MSKELIQTQMNVNNRQVRVMRVENVDYISLTDLAKYQNERDPSGVIRNWMSNKNSFDFYNLWEELHNENFNSVESHRIKIDEVGYNRFTMTPNRWKKEFNAIGIIPSSGKYSVGTLAHQGIEQKVRLERLNIIAKKQYGILQDSKGIKRLEKFDNNYIE